MATLLEFECPACGGGLEFDPASQQVKCPYCDTEFTPEAIEELTKSRKTESSQDLEWKEPTGEQWQDGEMVTYTCQSCGGELICDAHTAATHCPYCDNPVVLSSRLTGVLKPDLIIPFKLDKKAAEAALVRHMSGKKLLPKLFRSQNRIEKIQGVYVPFWLFDAESQADIRFHGTKVRSWSDSNYFYTQTRHYSVRRAGSIGFEAVPVDGSSKMENTLMESIEPFDLSQAIDFNSAYLSGFVADKYDVSSDETKTRANERIQNGTVQAFRNTANYYNTLIAENCNISLGNNRVRYALLPVWILTTQYQGKAYTFAMNAQTGKFVGDLPVDMGAYWRWFGLISAISTLAVFLLGTLLGFGG